MVSSAHYLASQAGVWVLRRGGNAVDGAVAAAATIAVVAPHLNGLGGDLFALVWEPGAEGPAGLNASGPSPRDLSREQLQSIGHKAMPVRGPLTIMVPGAVSGWAALIHRYGNLRLFDVLGPAIDYAEHGAPITARLAAAISSNRVLLEGDSGLRQVFLPADTALTEGQIFRNARLGASLREIGATDGESMYRGALAERIVAGIQANGGFLSRDDLAGFRSEWVDPLETSFRDRQFYELPPNTQGITALEMFNMAEIVLSKDFRHNSAAYIAALGDAILPAYEDRDRYVTDPRFSQPPLAEIVSKSYARERLEAAPALSTTSKNGDTVYLCAVDSSGLAVSLIQSHYMGFGSGVMAEETGIHFNNRGAYFSLEEGHVNRFEPGKRTMHTLIPAMSGRNGVFDMAFGSMGGDGQPQFQLQIAVNELVFGMGLQEAIEAPRFNYFCRSDQGVTLTVENRMGPNVVKDLQSLGFGLDIAEAWSSALGHAQAIRRNGQTSILEGAADPRGDGAALGY